MIAATISGCKSAETGRKTVINNELSSVVNEETIVRGNLTNKNFIIQKAEIEVYNDGKKVSMLASIRYQKTGNYLISMRSRNGIEIARIFLTRDTILINDRINKKLYYGSTGYLVKKYGISISAIPVILGDLINEKDNPEENLDCRSGERKINCLIEDRNVVYVVDCKLAKISNAQYRLENNENGIELNFSNFFGYGKFNYPGTIKIKDLLGETGIKIEIKKIDLSEEESLKFIPGNNYEKLMLR